MANSKAYGVRGIQRTISVPIKSGATFNAGDFLVLTTTGADRTIAAGSNYNPSTNVNTKILGRALHGTSDVIQAPNGYTHVDVIVAEPGTQFEMPLYHTTASSAVPSLSLLANDYELKQNTNGFACVDLTATTNKAVRVVDFVPNDFSAWPDTTSAGTTQFANVWVEFLGAACTLTGAR